MKSIVPLAARCRKNMTEYVSKAIALGVYLRSEKDKEVSFFSEKLGKFKATLVSGAKITSKFSQHCDVLNCVETRVVYKSRFTVTDVLLVNRFPLVRGNIPMLKRAIMLAHFLDKNMPDSVPDAVFWHNLYSGLDNGIIDFHKHLARLGYDAEHASCFMCKSRNVKAFSFQTQDFLCEACGFKMRGNEIVLNI